MRIRGVNPGGSNTALCSPFVGLICDQWALISDIFSDDILFGKRDEMVSCWDAFGLSFYWLFRNVVKQKALLAFVVIFALKSGIHWGEDTSKLFEMIERVGTYTGAEPRRKVLFNMP